MISKTDFGSKVRAETKKGKTKSWTPHPKKHSSLGSRDFSAKFNLFPLEGYLEGYARMAEMRFSFLTLLSGSF